ncbi:MAG: SRPBCC domain-containing protein [Alphaproteobacteria bacterium]
MIDKTVSPSPEFVISRVFEAPRELVWRAFTEADRLKHWWGPKGFKMIECRMDLRPGGTFVYGMRADGGFEMRARWTFRDILAPETLNFDMSFIDLNGNPARHPSSATWPMKMLSRVTFADQDGKTLLTTRVTAINPTDVERKTFEAGFESMKQGYGGTWDQLAAYLAKL